MIDRTILHYQIVEKLGEGGMGVVWKARDKHLDRFVALKVLPPDRVADPERKRRFVQEAKAASSLNHPNIVHIYDIAEFESVDFIAMELVQGRTLGQLIGRRGLRLNEALKYAVQITSALTRAHEAGIIHRDLKPSNIMIRDDGLVKVLDFGLAKLIEQVPGDEFAATETMDIEAGLHTEEGTIVGTPAYMSPEQAEGRSVDARSDIFSFGSVLYEMVTGHRAFQRATKVATQSAILHEEPKPPGEVPRDLEKVIIRCLRKDRERRFQHMADVKVALDELKEETESEKRAAAPELKRSRWVVLAPLAAAMLAGAAGLMWWRAGLKSVPPMPELQRLTSDTGLTTNPAISPDGKLVVYASDRAGKGNLDLWLQQIEGGEAVRLTNDLADDHEPAFSPDGTKIAFRSERGAGGIYIISTLGGEPRRIVSGGHWPQFSPDGALIAFTSPSGLVDQTICVVAATGGESREAARTSGSPTHALWSPDGRYLLYSGSPPPYDKSTRDWWVSPVNGGEPQRTGLYQRLRDAEVSPLEPRLWVRDQIYFTSSSRNTANLWRVRISSDAHELLGPPMRVTTGTNIDQDPSISSNGVMVFTSIQSAPDLWLLPIKANQGKVTGAPQQLTRDRFREFHSLSQDGTKLIYSTARSGRGDDIWLRDLVTSQEKAVAIDPATVKLLPSFSPDATQAAYLVLSEHDRSSIHVAALTAGTSRKVCDACTFNLSPPPEWTPDGTGILYLAAQDQVNLIHLLSGRTSEFLKVPKYTNLYTRYSRDGQWLTIAAFIPNGPRRIFVARVRNDNVAPENGWILVHEDLVLAEFPQWSPDGNMIYFFSYRDGSECLCARRLDPKSKRPVSSTFVVYRFSSARRSRTSFPAPLAVAVDKIVLSLTEQTGNIWMLKLPGE